MARITLSRPIAVRMGAPESHLQPGTHEIDDSYKEEWWFKSLVKSGAIIVIDEAPEKPILVEPTGMVQVSITSDKIEVLPAKEELSKIEIIPTEEEPANIEVVKSVMDVIIEPIKPDPPKNEASKKAVLQVAPKKFSRVKK